MVTFATSDKFCLQNAVPPNHSSVPPWHKREKGKVTEKEDWNVTKKDQIYNDANKFVSITKLKCSTDVNNTYC